MTQEQIIKLRVFIIRPTEHIYDTHPDLTRTVSGNAVSPERSLLQALPSEHEVSCVEVAQVDAQQRDGIARAGVDQHICAHLRHVIGLQIRQIGDRADA